MGGKRALIVILCSVLSSCYVGKPIGKGGERDYWRDKYKSCLEKNAMECAGEYDDAKMCVGIASGKCDETKKNLFVSETDFFHNWKVGQNSMDRFDKITQKQLQAKVQKYIIDRQKNK